MDAHVVKYRRSLTRTAHLTVRPSQAAAAAIDRYLLLAGPTAAGLLLWARAGTDRRTDTVPFHRPCSAYYADSANNTVVILIWLLYITTLLVYIVFAIIVIFTAMQHFICHFSYTFLRISLCV